MVNRSPTILADRSACETDRARDSQRPTAPFSAAIDLLCASSCAAFAGAAPLHPAGKDEALAFG